MDYVELLHLPAQPLLAWAIRTYQDQFAIVTSFQLEGMVLIDMASRLAQRVRVITVDTGRLPEETYLMMELVRARYPVDLEVATPDPEEVGELVRQYGPNCFFRSVELRLQCCQVRKVRPLLRKLEACRIRAWATGLRRSQSHARAQVPKIQTEQGRLKLSPLADWSDEELERYVRENDVPRHPLYAAGFTSIGCEPCTRPVQPGEHRRAGRWWWENDTVKECGIHLAGNGQVVRVRDFAKEGF